MHKAKILGQFETVKIYDDLYGKPFKCDWVAKHCFPIQILLISGSHCSHSFRGALLKIYRLPNFNMLFHILLTKFFKSELFSCLQKLLQKAYSFTDLYMGLFHGSHKLNSSTMLVYKKYYYFIFCCFGILTCQLFYCEHNFICL